MESSRRIGHCAHTTRVGAGPGESRVWRGKEKVRVMKKVGV